MRSCTTSSHTGKAWQVRFFVELLLCHRKSEALAEQSSPWGANICTSKKRTYLPSKEQQCQNLIDWVRELAR